jgi:deazaflavin-dependent oxidoreductase (nitroreductase family)
MRYHTPRERNTAMSSTRARGSLPGWLKPANRLVLALQRLGIPTGTIHVLTVLGRTSGKPRSTPVSVLTVGGVRYIVGGMADMDWVRNARAAGWGILAYGRKRERVTLVELPVPERAAILREFPRLVPGGISFFRRLYDLPRDPAALSDAFAALATRATVFRIEHAAPER